LLTLSKYIDLSFIDDKCIEHINLDAKINLKSISFKEMTNRLCRETINLSYSITPTSYDSSLVGKSITYGVRLDKSNAVATEWGTYTDDAQGLLPAYTDFNNSQFIDNGWLSRWPFNQIRPCIIKDEQIIGYLNPNDYTKFEDGTDAPITDRDSGFVMIEFPKIYYKLSSDDNYIDIKISDTMQEGFTCAPFIYKGVENSKLYVGAYLTLNSQFTTSGFESNSGVSLDQSASFIFSTAHKYLYNHLPNNYNFLTFDVLTLIQTLSIILFKATDIQRTLGCGYSSSPTSYVTGLLNTKGMYYGTNAFGTGTKLFGLEDFHSARPTLVCGVWVDESGYFRYADNNIDTNYTASGLNSFLNNNQACTIRSGLRIGDDIFGKNEMGYFFKEGTGTTNTKAFCDAYAITKNDFIDFGMPSSSYYNGIFSFKLGYRTTTHTKRAAKLIY